MAARLLAKLAEPVGGMEELAGLRLRAKNCPLPLSVTLSVAALAWLAVAVPLKVARAKPLAALGDPLPTVRLPVAGPTITPPAASVTWTVDAKVGATPRPAPVRLAGAANATSSVPVKVLPPTVTAASSSRRV